MLKVTSTPVVKTIVATTETNGNKQGDAITYLAPFLNIAKIERAIDVPSGTLLRYSKGMKTSYAKENEALLATLCSKLISQLEIVKGLPF
jgi:hypothetical protein